MAIMLSKVSVKNKNIFVRNMYGYELNLIVVVLWLIVAKLVFLRRLDLHSHWIFLFSRLLKFYLSRPLTHPIAKLGNENPPNWVMKMRQIG